MADSSKALAYYIVKHLNAVRDSACMSPEQNESLDVAAQCLMDVYCVDPALEEHRALFGDSGKSEKSSLLQKIYDDYKKRNPNPTKAKNGGNNTNEVPETNIIVTEQDKIAAELLKTRGNAFMKDEKFHEAIDCYNKAAAKDPYNPVYPGNRAVAHTKLEMHEEAAQDARAAIAIDPKYSKAYSRLGHALFALQKYAKSARAYQRGLRIDPNNAAMKQAYDAARELQNSSGSNESEDSEIDNNDDDDDVDVDVDGDTGRNAAALDGQGNASNGDGGAGMGDFSSLLRNPQLMRMAQDMMQKNPGLAQMAQQFAANSGGAGGGNGFDMNRLSAMMNDPNMMNMAQQVMGGARGGAGGARGAKRGGGGSASSSRKK